MVGFSSLCGALLILMRYVFSVLVSGEPDLGGAFCFFVFFGLVLFYVSCCLSHIVHGARQRYYHTTVVEVRNMRGTKAGRRR